MTARSWREIQAEAEKLDPWFSSPEAQEIYDAETKRIEAEREGHALSVLRKDEGLTQKKVAEIMGVSQARISQIEHGQIHSLEPLRSYVSAIGGTLELTIRQGALSTGLHLPGDVAVAAGSTAGRKPTEVDLGEESSGQKNAA